MLFSESIPGTLQEQLNVSAFVRILDELQGFKSETIAASLYSYNPAVLMDKKWLIKELAEYGITDIPLDYPMQVIRQLLLNIDTVCRTRGSKIGLELYCSLLSLGEVTIDDSLFYGQTHCILLDSTQQGFITEGKSSDIFYICDDTDILNPEQKITITIRSKFFSNDYPQEKEVIKSYIENTINRQLGFSPNKNVEFIYLSRIEFFYHRLLNPYFI